MNLGCILWAIVFTGTAIAVIGYIIRSFYWFINDGKAAKREGRKRDPKYTSGFMISLIWIVLIIAAAVFLLILASGIMNNMYQQAHTKPEMLHIDIPDLKKK